MITIDEIIETCGGRKAIASHADKLTPDAVRKWRGVGIPEKHWTTVISLHGKRLTPKKLHDLNNRLRAGQSS